VTLEKPAPSVSRFGIAGPALVSGMDLVWLVLPAMKRLLAIWLLASAVTAFAASVPTASILPEPANAAANSNPMDRVVERIVALAKRERRFILLDCAAEWCHWCHVMDETTMWT